MCVVIYIKRNSCAFIIAIDSIIVFKQQWPISCFPHIVAGEVIKVKEPRTFRLNVISYTS